MSAISFRFSLMPLGGLAGTLIIAIACSVPVRADCIGSSDLHNWSPCGEEPSSGIRAHPAPAPDPRIQRADQLNQQGNEAYGAGSYERAADLFFEAFTLYGLPVYRENYNLAKSQILITAANALWGRDWSSAIAKLEEAQRWHYSADIDAAIHRARGAQAAGFAADSYNRQNYDEAILYWREAIRWSGDRKYEKDIADAMFQKGKGKLNKIYLTTPNRAQLYAEIERLADEGLRLNPKDARFLELRAAAKLDGALAATSSGSISSLKARLDPAFAAYRQFIEVSRTRGNLNGGADAALQSGMRALSSRVRNSSDWSDVTEIYNNWARMLGGGPSGAAAAIAERALRGELGGASPAIGEVSPVYEERRRAQELSTIADQPISGVGNGADPSRNEVKLSPFGVGTTRYSGAGPDEPWPPPTPDIRFNKTDLDKSGFFSPHENPKMEELHSRIVKANSELTALDRSLGEVTDPLVKKPLQVHKEKITETIEAEMKEYQKEKTSYSIPPKK